MRQIAAIGGLVLLSGCGGGGGSPTRPSRVPQSLTVNPTATNLIKIAQEQDLHRKHPLQHGRRQHGFGHLAKR
jgi:hypothetical protein